MKTNLINRAQMIKKGDSLKSESDLMKSSHMNVVTVNQF